MRLARVDRGAQAEASGELRRLVRGPRGTKRGVAVAIGPFLGGYLVQAVSWRLIFVINLPLALAVVVIAVRHVPESRDTAMPLHLDIPGVVLAALGLAGITYALTEAGQHGWGSPSVIVHCFGRAIGSGGSVVVTEWYDARCRLVGPCYVPRERSASWHPSAPWPWRRVR